MKLIFFDLDGTLLPGTTASLEIARATGTTAQLLDLERSHPFVVGPLLNILRPEDKVSIAERLCLQLGTTLEDCCAFGDSLSDFYLFERVGFSVAVNGTAALREKASASYEGEDLLESFHTMLRMMGCDDTKPK
jgi:phosphoserine phosphatase